VLVFSLVSFVITSEPARAPATVGVATTATTQLCRAGSVTPQVVPLGAREKSPLKVSDVIAAATLWLFWIAIVCDALARPTFTLPNASDPGEIVSGVVPTPATAT